MYPNAGGNDNEFADYNPRKRRKTTRDPKESAALGIFGSESEDDGPGKRWKDKSLRGKGMSFVKSGKKDDDSEEEDDDDDEYAEGAEGANDGDKHSAYPEDVDMEDAQDSEAPRGGLGLGAKPQTSFRPSLGNGGGGFGFSPAARSSGLGAGDGGARASPFGMGFRPASEAAPVLRKELDVETPTMRQSMPSAFSTPTPGRGAKPTNGTPINKMSFAARMMAKMGYKEGEGLGKDGTGRSGVIEVTLRPQGVGLGAVREKSKQERDEERRQAQIRGEVIDDSEEEERKKKAAQRAKAKANRIEGDSGSGMSTPKRKPKTKYQSLPEMLKAAPGLKIPDAFTPILDMTGPDQKYLTAGSGLATPTTGAPESTEVVEARKLARRAQNDLSSFVEEWKSLEERKAYVNLQIAQQQQAVEAQEEAAVQLRTAAEVVRGLTDAVKDGQWDPVIDALTKLESLDVAGNDELSSIAVAAIHPFFRQAVEGWQPLEDPKLSGVASDGFVLALRGISHLLGLQVESTEAQKKLIAIKHSHQPSLTGKSHSRAHKTTPYESLMYNIWFPKVRSAITNTWDVHDPSSLLTFLDHWTPLLPPFIKSQILEQLIVRKLDDAIQSWNPKKRSRTSTLPHLWLFPWLPYLPSHHLDARSSSGLVADVKRKFRTLIDSWDFRRGVIPGLTQWRDLLRPSSSSSRDDTWTPLLLNHVLPTLSRYFRTNFQVAPQDQEPYMKTLTHVFEWQPVLGDRMLAQLLVNELFPMWHDVLHQWLTMDGVNYLEIRDWFDFWRSVIPTEISALPVVNAEWKKGEALINQALDLGERAKTELPAPSKPAAGSSTPVPETPQVPEKKAEEVSFRHQVEDWCMERDLQFIPEKSTLEAGGPVYRVTASAIGKGGVLVYIKGDGIFAQIKRGVWTPMGREMDALFELAHR